MKGIKKIAYTTIGFISLILGVIGVILPILPTTLFLLLMTHDIGVVSAMADSIVVLSNGRVMEYAAAKDVLENPQNDYTVKLLSAVPRLRREKA